MNQKAIFLSTGDRGNVRRSRGIGDERVLCRHNKPSDASRTRPLNLFPTPRYHRELLGFPCPCTYVRPPERVTLPSVGIISPSTAAAKNMNPCRSFPRQFGALVRKNFLVKRRSKLQLVRASSCLKHQLAWCTRRYVRNQQFDSANGKPHLPVHTLLRWQPNCRFGPKGQLRVWTKDSLCIAGLKDPARRLGTPLSINSCSNV